MNQLRIPDGDLIKRFVQAGDEESFRETGQRQMRLRPRSCCWHRKRAGSRTAAAGCRMSHDIAGSTCAGRMGVDGGGSRLSRRGRKNIRRNTMEELDAALDCIPEKYRQALLMHHVEELSHGEIAEELAIPAGTVAWRISHGRKKLKRALQSVRAMAGISALFGLLCSEAATAEMAGTGTLFKTADVSSFSSSPCLCGSGGSSSVAAFWRRCLLPPRSACRSRSRGR